MADATENNVLQVNGTPLHDLSIPNLIGKPPGSNEEIGKWALTILREIEKLGGASALEVWLKETDNGEKNLPSRPEFPEYPLALYSQPSTTPRNLSQRAVIKIYSILAYTYINVDIEGTGITGSGGAWGIGFGVLWGAGELEIVGSQSLQSFASRVTKFNVAKGGIAAVIMFYDDSDQHVGHITGLGVGIGSAVGFHGPFEFSIRHFK
ncbi:hypothetical protein EDB19DRAFT_1826436 [Suillus lakei]|nr:hypothetical protein EDB19DRAFT_1826436 [Suillus lakei]